MDQNLQNMNLDLILYFFVISCVAKIQIPFQRSYFEIGKFIYENTRTVFNTDISFIGNNGRHIWRYYPVIMIAVEHFPNIYTFSCIEK